MKTTAQDRVQKVFDDHTQPLRAEIDDLKSQLAEKDKIIKDLNAVNLELMQPIGLNQAPNPERSVATDDATK